MKIICKPRRAGKTIELIKIAAEKQSYIVCLHRKECVRIADLARELGLKIQFPLTADEFIRKNYHACGIKGGFLIDNADMLLQSMTRVPIHAISVTEEEKEE